MTKDSKKIYLELALNRAGKKLARVQRFSESDAQIIDAQEDYYFCKAMLEQHVRGLS